MTRIAVAATLVALFIQPTQAADVPTATQRARVAHLLATVRPLVAVRTVVLKGALGRTNSKRASLFASSAATAAAKAQRLAMNPLPCPRIDMVDGKAPGVVPIAPADLISITGCGFSPHGRTLKSAHQLFFYGPNFPRSNLAASSWTDTKIVAKIDPSITGVMDAYGTITLVVGTLRVSGLSFEAPQSQAYTVSNIPASAVTLSAAAPTNNTYVYCFMYCVPNLKNYLWGPNGYLWPQQGFVAEVRRMQAETPFRVTHTDVFDFSGLSPSFVIAHLTPPEIIPVPITKQMCFADGETLVQNGSYRAAWDGSKLSVNVGEESCADPDPNSLIIGHSDYMVEAWVYGPRGLTNPQFWGNI